MVLGLNHVIVVWFVPHCYPGSANSTHIHSFDGLGIHPYGHPLHGKVLKHFIYTLDGSVIQSEVALGLNHVIVVLFEPSCYPGSANSTHHIHSFDGLGIHPYGHPLHGKVMNHFIYTLDGSVIQSEVALCLNHIIVVWFVPSCYSGLASSTHLHCFDGLEIHPYGHPLHGNMLKHFIYTLDGSVIHYEVALGLNHVIVVLFEPSCYPGSANSTHHIHSFDGLGIHPYGHPLHGKVMNHFIYTLDGSVIQSEVALCLNHVIVVWFVPSCYPGLESFTHLHGFDGLGIHPYGHPLHGNVLKHFIYTLYGSVIQSEVALCLNHIIVAWFVPSYYSGLASSTHLHGFDRLEIHP